jgi:signal transduction histidine kinase
MVIGYTLCSTVQLTQAVVGYLTPWVDAVYSVETLDQIAAQDHPCIVVIEYTTPTLDLSAYSHRNCASLLLIPPSDPVAEDYAFRCGVTDFLTLPLEARYMAHRLKHLMNLLMSAPERKNNEMVHALHDTAIALSATLNFESVLDRILDNLEKVIPYRLGSVLMVLGNSVYIARHRGYEPYGVTHRLPHLRYKLNESPALVHMAGTRRPLLIATAEAFERWFFSQEWNHMAQSYIGAPIFIDDHIAGFVNLIQDQPFAFSKEHLYHLEIFASQVSLAISNAQLHDRILRHSSEIEQRLRNLIAIYEIGKTLNSTLDPQSVYRVMYREVAQGLFSASNMYIVLLEQDQGQYVFGIEHGLELNADALARKTVHPDLLKHILYTHGTIQHDRFLYEPMLSQDRVIGILQLEGDRTFHDVDFALLSTVTGQATIAVENARLVTEIRRYANELEQRVEIRTEELREALRKEHQLSVMKSQFLQMVSHQFRTPLTQIQSANQILQLYDDRLKREEKIKRNEAINEAIHSMITFLENATDIRKLSEGIVEFTPTLLNPHHLTQSLIESFKTQIGLHHQIIYQVEGEHKVYSLDSRRWHKIVEELLRNAVKFSAEGTVIRCQLIILEHELMLKIEDQGIGIALEDQTRVFEVFERGRNAENISGAGLGLTLVKNYVELHRGVIYLTSQLGKGTIVKVKIPRYEGSV